LAALFAGVGAPPPNALASTTVWASLEVLLLLLPGRPLLLFRALNMATVAKALPALLLGVGAPPPNAPAMAKVVTRFDVLLLLPRPLPNRDPPPPPCPPRPPNAATVPTVLPRASSTTASVAVACGLLLRATAATGLSLPEDTPLINITCFIVWSD